MQPFIIDSDQDRARILFDHLKNTFTEITEANNYLETIGDVATVIQSLTEKGIDLLFIHKSNHNAETLISQLTANIWTVVYSGGGINESYQQTHIATYKGVFDTRNHTDFLSTVDKVVTVLQNNKPKEEQSIEFKKIFGYNPILEAKLNFLHQCLLPESIPTQLPDILNEYAAAFTTFKEKATGKTKDNAFDADYVGALREFRDALLA